MIEPRRFQEFLKHQAEYEAMLKKEIQAEYEKVNKAIEEWDKRRNYDPLKSQLEQDRNEHKAAVESFQKERDKYTSDMQQWHAGLTKKEAELVKKAAEIADQNSLLLSAQSNHEQKVKADRASIDQRSKDLDAREAEVNSLHSALQNREKEMAKKNQKVLDAITSLSSLR